MQFVFNEQQTLIAETAKAFFVQQATSERTRAAMAGARGIDYALWMACTQELGLAGVALPETAGGGGLGHVELAIIAEAAGAQVAALPFIVSLAIAAPAILEGGTKVQREIWLPRLAAGEAIASFGEGEVVSTDNRLTATLLLPHGFAADLFVIISADLAWIVERDAEGLHLEPRATMDQTRPMVWARLDDVVAEPLANGMLARAAALRTGSIAIAADALGGAQACLDRTVAYVQERVQFGRTIGSFQAVKHRLADMMVEIEQARSAVYWAACAADEHTADAEIAVHAAKAFATDTYANCAGHMIQLHGGIGFTWEHDAHLFFKRAQANRSLLGSPDWHRERVACLIGLGGLA